MKERKPFALGEYLRDMMQALNEAQAEQYAPGWITLDGVDRAGDSVRMMVRREDAEKLEGR